MSITLPITTILAVTLGSVRAAAWLALCPPFNGKGIPLTARGLLSVAMALPFAEQLTNELTTQIATTGLTASVLLSDVASQVLVGAALGFCAQLLIAAVQAAGNLIDLFGGFSIAFAFDPLSFTGSSVLGRFYGLAATALLFATDSHHLIIAGFARSYTAMPLAGGWSTERLQQILTDGIGQMMIAAAQIAGPMIVVLFLIDLALGVLTRISPALNVFALTFPAKILLTLIFASTAVRYLPTAVRLVVDQAVNAMITFTGS